MAEVAVAFRACSVDGCEVKAEAKGMCWKHYGRWRRNGDPEASGQHGGSRTEPGPTANVPDPQPVRVLREVLVWQRSIRRGWGWAWPTALDQALRGLDLVERASWFEVLNAHREAWRSAYLGHPVERPFPVAMLSAVIEPEPWQSYQRRSGPPLVLHGQRHDGESRLEPVHVPWCA